MGVDPDALGRAIKAQLETVAKLGGDVVQIYTTPRVVGLLERANAEAERLQDEYVGVEHVLIAIADERDGESARILVEFEITKERVYQALRDIRGTARVDSPTAESSYQALAKYSRDLTAFAEQGALDPVIGREVEVDRVMQVLNRRTKNNPVLIGRGGRRQDGDRRGPRAAHRRRRRARAAPRQACDGARHGPAPRRLEVPR